MEQSSQGGSIMSKCESIAKKVEPAMGPTNSPLRIGTKTSKKGPVPVYSHTSPKNSSLK